MDTFAPTVRSAILQVLLALATAHKGDIIIEQADVKNAYLNAWMKDDETVFMDLPELYSDLRKLPKPVNDASRNGNHIVPRLKRPFYGTKQGAHHWYEKLKTTLVRLGFTVCSANSATFFKVEEEEFIVIAAATDDFTIITNSRVLSTKKKLHHFARQ